MAAVRKTVSLHRKVLVYNFSVPLQVRPQICNELTKEFSLLKNKDPWNTEIRISLSGTNRVL